MKTARTRIFVVNEEVEHSHINYSTCCVFRARCFSAVFSVQTGCRKSSCGFRGYRNWIKHGDSLLYGYFLYFATINYTSIKMLKIG